MHLWSKKDVTRLFKIGLMFIPILIFSDHISALPNLPENNSEQQKLIILGDSLSAAYGLTQEQGWVSLLQNAWQVQRIYVINAAISGETTDGGLSRLPRLLEQHQPTHLYIELSGNDGLQGHSVKKMQRNIEEMVDLAHVQGVKVILQEMLVPTNYGRRYNEMFMQMFVDISQKYNIPLIPFFMRDIALDKSLMQKDQIHPNLQAQPLIASYMQEQLEPLILQQADQKKQINE